MPVNRTLSLAILLITVLLISISSGQSTLSIGALFPLGGNHAAAQVRREAGDIAAEMLTEDDNFDMVVELEVLGDNANVSLAIEQAYSHITNNKKIIIGPNSSSQSVAVSHLARAFKIPIISYASTAEALTTTDPHSFFFRTCPSDVIQVTTWISIMKNFNWNICSIIASDDTYGFGNANNFRTRAISKGIVVDSVSYFPKGASKESLVENINALKMGNAKIIFLMTEGIDGRNVIDVAHENGIIGADSGFTWVLSEAIASVAQLFPQGDENVESRKEALSGSLGTRPRGGEGALWTAFVEKVGSTPKDNFVPYVVDAVFTVAHAFKSYCVENPTCVFDDINGEEWKTHLLNVDFEGVTGRVAFNENNDRVGLYDVVNFRNDNVSVVKVGEWTDGSGINVSGIIWPDGTTNVPRDQIGVERYIGWDHALAIAIIVLVGIFLTCIILVFAFVFYHRENHIIRYSSPFFLYSILLGLVLIYVSLIFWLGYPAVYSCNLKIWLGFVGFTLVFASQITKTFRVYRIFKKRTRIKKVVLKNTHLLKYVAIFTLPTLVILAVWTGVDMLQPVLIPNNSRTYFNIYCQSKSSAWAMVAFLYCAVLVFVTTFLSFRTRKIPDGFRETYWINLATYNTLFCALVGITIGYVISDNLLASHIIVFICVLIGATAILGLLFLPKIIGVMSKKDLSSSSRREKSTRSKSIDNIDS